MPEFKPVPAEDFCERQNEDENPINPEEINMPLNSAGDTHLLAAIQTGNLGLMKQLIALGADVNQANLKSFTPLIVATRAGWEEGVELLVQSGADVEQQSASKSTTLSFAAAKGQIEVANVAGVWCSSGFEGQWIHSADARCWNGVC